MTTAGVKLLRETAKCTLYDHKRNEDIIKELKTTSFGKINIYKNKWIQCVHRMDRPRFLNAVMKYKPAGKRYPGCSLKRLLDLYIETRVHNNAQRA
jgi:hypothetical protein